MIHCGFAALHFRGLQWGHRRILKIFQKKVLVELAIWLPFIEHMNKNQFDPCVILAAIQKRQELAEQIKDLPKKMEVIQWMITLNQSYWWYVVHLLNFFFCSSSLSRTSDSVIFCCFCWRIIKPDSLSQNANGDCKFIFVVDFGLCLMISWLLPVCLLNQKQD